MAKCCRRFEDSLWADVIAVLREFRLLESEIRAQGGNRSLISRRLDSAFYSRGWQEKGFVTAILIDDRRFESPTHRVDCFKGRVALEVERNNKDPFFDRDLNFRLLFELRAIDVSVIVTGLRASGDLQSAGERGFLRAGNHSPWRRRGLSCADICDFRAALRGGCRSRANAVAAKGDPLLQ